MDKITVEQRFGRAAAVGVAGGGVALAMMATEPYIGLDGSFLRVATAGAFLAGLCVARGFGGEGNIAVFRAGFFFCLATVLGAFLAVMLLPVDLAIMRTGIAQALFDGMTEMLLGPVYVIEILTKGGLVPLLWGAGAFGVYKVSLRNADTGHRAQYTELRG